MVRAVQTAAVVARSDREAAASRARIVKSTRIASIDVLRGIAVVLMAVDHVRVFSGPPAGGPSPGIFFTRWITHVVAPVFVFLAGTAAYLHGQKLGDRRTLSRFLVVRGLWLVFLAGAVSPWLFENHPMGNGPPPPGYTWTLWQLYAVFAIAVGILYVACRWFAEVKRTSRSPWLSYL